MRHDLRRDGEAFRLRPAEIEDDAFILSLRTDPTLSQFIGATDASPERQRAWMEAYFGRPGDYYWIIEHRASGRADGTIALYDVTEGRGEWGRWILRPGSLAAVESVLLLSDVAFEDLGMAEIYCRTTLANHKVVAFHDGMGWERKALLPDCTPLGDAVEHGLTHALWAEKREGWRTMARRLGRRP